MNAEFYNLVIKYIRIGYSEEDAEILAANELEEDIED